MSGRSCPRWTQITLSLLTPVAKQLEFPYPNLTQEMERRNKIAIGGMYVHEANVLTKVGIREIV